MRRVVCALTVAAMVLAGVACDTTQPTQGSATSAAVEFDALATVELYDCYDRLNNGVFDRIICFLAPAVGEDSNLVIRRVPWRYSFRVIMLRAGETFPEVVAGSVNTDDFAVFDNVTRFDDIVASAPIRLPEPPYTFENPRRVSAGHRDFFAAYVDYSPPDPRADRAPLPIPTPNILGETAASPGASPRYGTEVNAGDAVIFEASKQLLAQGPLIFPFNIDENLTLNARLFIGGTVATPNAGNIQSSDTDGAGVSFNYISD